MSHPSESPSAAWDQVAPLLDAVIDELPLADRHLVLARFMEGETHAALARALDLSEDAVRMRVNRALEKLRLRLARRGVSTSVAALSLALPVHGAAPPAAALALKVSQAALASAAASTLSLSSIALLIMTKKTAVVSAGVLLLAAATGLLIYQNRASSSEGAGQPTAQLPMNGSSGGEQATAFPDRPRTVSSQRRTKDHKEPEPSGEISDSEIVRMTLEGSNGMFYHQTFGPRADDRLSSLGAGLHLSDAQKLKVQAILDQAVKNPRVVLAVLPDGTIQKIATPAFGRPDESTFSLAGNSPYVDQIRGELTAAQQAEFDQMRDAERDQAQRLRAQSEMVNFQQVVSLQPDQERQVAQILADQPIFDFTAPESVLTENEEKKRAALREVLTPAQMTVYEENFRTMQDAAQAAQRQQQRTAGK